MLERPLAKPQKLGKQCQSVNLSEFPHGYRLALMPTDEKAISDPFTIYIRKEEEKKSTSTFFYKFLESSTQTVITGKVPLQLHFYREEGSSGLCASLEEKKEADIQVGDILVLAHKGEKKEEKHCLTFKVRDVYGDKILQYQIQLHYGNQKPFESHDHRIREWERIIRGEIREQDSLFFSSYLVEKIRSPSPDLLSGTIFSELSARLPAQIFARGYSNPGPNPDDCSREVISGDMHGNTLKFFFMLIKHAFIQGITPADYQTIVTILAKEEPKDEKDKDEKKIQDKDILDYQSILNKIQLTKPKVARRFISGGDNMGDRAGDDYFTIRLVERLDHLLIEQKIDEPPLFLFIMIGNHDLEYHQHMLYEKRVTLGCGQAASLARLEKLIALKLVPSKEEINSIYLNTYVPHLRWVTCSFNPTDNELTIVSHAPLQADTLWNATRLFYPPLPYQDDSIAGMITTIDTINHGLWSYFEKKENNLVEYNERRTDPISIITWSRRPCWIRKSHPDGYNCRFVHGHTDVSYEELFCKPPHVICLNNQLGFARGEYEGDYSVVLTDNVFSELDIIQTFDAKRIAPALAPAPAPAPAAMLTVIPAITPSSTIVTSAVLAKRPRKLLLDTSLAGLVELIVSKEFKEFKELKELKELKGLREFSTSCAKNRININANIHEIMKARGATGVFSKNPLTLLGLAVLMSSNDFGSSVAYVSIITCLLSYGATAALVLEDTEVTKEIKNQEISNLLAVFGQLEKSYSAFWRTLPVLSDEESIENRNKTLERFYGFIIDKMVSETQNDERKNILKFALHSFMLLQGTPISDEEKSPLFKKDSYKVAYESCKEVVDNTNKQAKIDYLFRMAKNNDEIKIETFREIINTRNEKKDTPLAVAIKHNSVKFVDAFIDSKADLTQTDAENHPPFYLAIRNNSFDVTQLLVEKKIDEMMTINASDAIFYPSIQVFLKVERDSSITLSALHLAIILGKNLIALDLIETPQRLEERIQGKTIIELVEYMATQQDNSHIRQAIYEKVLLESKSATRSRSLTTKINSFCRFPRGYLSTTCDEWLQAINTEEQIQNKHKNICTALTFLLLEAASLSATYFILGAAAITLASMLLAAVIGFIAGVLLAQAVRCCFFQPKLEWAGDRGAIQEIRRVSCSS